MSFNVHVPAQNVTVNPIDRSNINQTTLAQFPIALTDFRVHDALQTVLPGTPATDDLGLIGTAFGTTSPTIEAGDLKAAGATTRYARCLVPLPAEYDSGETLQIAVHCQMVTTVSDTSCTVDLEAYLSDQEGGIGSDLCATATIDMNSLTGADAVFTITATGLVAGDILDVRVAIICNDAASGTAVTPQIGNVELRCDIRA